MIKKIKSSSLDDKKISETDAVFNKELDEFDFSKVIVRKPWGREYLTYDGNEVAIWILYIKKDASTSMHCHPNKKTNLIVLAGEAICSTLENNFNLKEGDMLILDKKVFHSTKAVSDNGIIVMEIESPPEKTDLIRLKDLYGRESKGYELQNEMSFDLSEHERVFLKQRESDLNRIIGNMNISIKIFEDYLILKDFLRLNKDSICILIEGKLIGCGNNEIFETGDVLCMDDLEKQESIDLTKLIKIINIKKNILDFD